MGSFLSLFFDSAEEEDAPSLWALLDDQDEVDWDAIHERLSTHPEEAAAYCVTIDKSPLIRALLYGTAPVAVIQAFLNAFDESVFHADRHQMTPLLAALLGSSLRPANDQHQQENDYEIAKLVLEANRPACRLEDRQGRLPIHFVRSNVDVAQMLVNEHPEGVTQVDVSGRLPLHYCVQQTTSVEEREQGAEPQDPLSTATPRRLALPDPRIVKLLTEQAKATLPCGGVLLKDKTKDGSSPLDILYRELKSFLEQESKPRDNQLDTLWEILTIMVETARPHHEPFQLVHSLVSLHSPAVILAEALRRFPHQAVERDKDGRTPLMIAASTIDAVEPAVICELVKCNPAAARMTDADGRLPIDFIAEKGVYDEGVFEALVMAEPRAVDTRDLKFGQHPFLTAALAGKDSNESSIYHLLRAKPHVIKYFMHD